MKSNILQAVVAVCWFITCAHALSDEEFQEFTPGTISINGQYYDTNSNGLPDHKTGDFPNQGNPNSIQEQSHRFRIPVNPTYDEEGGCTPMGPVGMALNGVVFFNAFTAELSSAPECEELDDCGGHPAPLGTYHYHADPTCIKQNQSGVILGLAFDGYPICRELDANGKLQTTEAQHLDKCHGKPRDDGTYCYYVSSDYPFILGCYRGKVDSSVLSRGQGPEGGNNRRGGQRPQGGGQGLEGMCHKPFNVTPNACAQRGNRIGQGDPGSQGGSGQGSPGSRRFGQGGQGPSGGQGGQGPSGGQGGQGGPGSQGGFGQGGSGSRRFGQGGQGPSGGQGGQGSSGGQGGQGPSGGQGGQGPSGGQGGPGGQGSQGGFGQGGPGSRRRFGQGGPGSQGPPGFGQGPPGGLRHGHPGGFGHRRPHHGGPGKGKGSGPRGKRSVSVLAAGIARRASRIDW